ncbi:hypothetical protein Alg130_10278 [Pyrenophora tritici-repentis]|nr:hypothetical protein Alg130_10278 [Pyrenophora tritici-repentis]
MYPVVDPNFQDDLHTSVGQTTWKSEPEQPWQPNYAESTAWYSPSYAMPSHANPNHDQPQHSAYADGFASPHTPPTTRPVDSVPSWVQRTAIKTKDIANNQESYSQSYSESDDSEDDDSASQKSSTSTTKDNCAAPEVMKLGKWVGNVNNLNITDSQKPLYVCLMKCTRHGQVVQCGQTFGRSEHRRRHCKTVHSKERLYICKVPDCEKSFSRGDNLRDHYWSHVERGGRGGKNKKMGIPELKAILGPKEKELAKRLKEKLKIHKEKKELAKKLKYKLNIHKEIMEKA